MALSPINYTYLHSHVTPATMLVAALLIVLYTVLLSPMQCLHMVMRKPRESLDLLLKTCQRTFRATFSKCYSGERCWHERH